MGPELLIIDMILGALEVASKASTLLNKARSEGRTVTEEEYDEIVSANKLKRAKWDAGNG